MARIHLVQLLCPNRHCIIAAAWEEGRATYETTVKFMRASYAKLQGEWRCWLCGSTELEFEDGMTGFLSMQEAAPHLVKTAQMNMITRALLERLRRQTRN